MNAKARYAVALAALLLGSLTVLAACGASVVAPGASPLSPSATETAAYLPLVAKSVEPSATPGLTPEATAMPTTTASPTATPEPKAAPTRTASPAVSTATPVTPTPNAPASPTLTPVPTTVPSNTPAATAIPTAQPSPTTVPPPPAGGAFVADHQVVGQFEQIPAGALAAAAAKRVLFERASTGGYISALGLDCLQGTRGEAACASYAQTPYEYDRRKWNWELWNPTPYSAGEKVLQFESVANREQANYDVLGMKFCYLDWFMQDFGNYRDMMLRLEAAYPGKTFIWTTQALALQWIEDKRGQSVQDFNDALRAYARANNKVLYDLADIESHDPSGARCSSGLETLCPQYWSDGEGHPNQTGSLRMAKGFWWLMARISGWQ